MKDNNTNYVGGGGLSLGAVLTCIFVVLKLCHVIDWKWLWVFSPILIELGLVLLILLICFIIVLVHVLRK